MVAGSCSDCDSSSLAHASGRGQGGPGQLMIRCIMEALILLSVQLDVHPAFHRKPPPVPSLGQSSLKGKHREEEARGQQDSPVAPGTATHPPTSASPGRRLRQEAGGMGPGTQPERDGKQRGTLDIIGPGNIGKYA